MTDLTNFDFDGVKPANSPLLGLPTFLIIIGLASLGYAFYLKHKSTTLKGFKMDFPSE